MREPIACSDSLPLHRYAGETSSIGMAPLAHLPEQLVITNPHLTRSLPCQFCGWIWLPMYIYICMYDTAQHNIILTFKPKYFTSLFHDCFDLSPPACTYVHRSKQTPETNWTSRYIQKTLMLSIVYRWTTNAAVLMAIKIGTIPTGVGTILAYLPRSRAVRMIWATTAAKWLITYM